MNLLVTNYPWLNELALAIPALILLTAFIFLMQNRIYGMINNFAWQSSLIVIAALLQAIINQRQELYILASITFILKVLFIPYLLRYLVRKLNIRHKVTTITHPFLLLIGAALLVLFCYHIITPDHHLVAINNITAVALATTLMGMMLLITHHKAICYTIGFMAMENGIFFAALVSSQGMPMIVELGIAFDVLVAAILFGVFFFHMRKSIESLDVNHLNLLREDITP